MTYCFTSQWYVVEIWEAISLDYERDKPNANGEWMHGHRIEWKGTVTLSWARCLTHCKTWVSRNCELGYKWKATSSCRFDHISQSCQSDNTNREANRSKGSLWPGCNSLLWRVVLWYLHCKAYNSTLVFPLVLDHAPLQMHLLISRRSSLLLADAENIYGAWKQQTKTDKSRTAFVLCLSLYHSFPVAQTNIMLFFYDIPERSVDTRVLWYFYYLLLKPTCWGP